MRTRLGLTVALAVLAACGASPTDPASGTTGATPPPTGDGGTPAPGAGTVGGIALDTRGRPIAGALVWIDPALTTGLVTTHTGADGRYSASGATQLPYFARAWTQVSYRGKNYCLRLAGATATDYDSFTLASGVVRDFRWQLTGPIPDLEDQYFGGEVRLMGDGSAPGTNDVELKLAPTGPLIDGSAGQVVVRTVKAYDLAQDIPAGAYTVSATMIAPDGTRTPLKVGTSYGAGADTMPLEFEPTTLPSCSNGSGLARAFVYWTLPGGD